MLNFLAVDAGGTSTRAVILGPDGRCIGFGRAAGGNPISSGPERAAAAVVAATRAALDASGATLEGSPPATLALAGSRVHESTDWIAAPLARLGLTSGVVLLSDLLATFSSGGPELDGYAMVSGTGAAAIRVRAGRVDATSDGLGWLLGDTGSGFWIGHQVARAAAAALDGRAPRTRLAELVLEELGIEDDGTRHEEGRLESLRRLTESVYAARPVELARFAPLAFAAGDDRVARAILAEASESTVATLRALVLPELAGPVVLGGGVLGRLDDVPAAIETAQRAAGHVPDVRRVHDGAVGAAVLALRGGGVEVTSEVFERITVTLAALR